MHGAFEFVFRQPDMIPLQIHPRFQRPSVHVLEFVNTNAHMLFDCFGDFNIVGIKNKLHRDEACFRQAGFARKMFGHNCA